MIWGSVPEQEQETYHSPPFSAEVRNEQSSTSTPPACPTWCIKGKLYRTHARASFWSGSELFKMLDYYTNH